MRGLLAWATWGLPSTSRLPARGSDLLMRTAQARVRKGQKSSSAIFLGAVPLEDRGLGGLDLVGAADRCGVRGVLQDRRVLLGDGTEDLSEGLEHLAAL